MTAARPRAAERPRKPRTTGRLIFRLVIVLVLIGVLGVALVGFQRMKEQMIGQILVKMAPPPAPVAAVAAQREDVPRYLQGIGTACSVPMPSR